MPHLTKHTSFTPSAAAPADQAPAFANAAHSMYVVAST